MTSLTDLIIWLVLLVSVFTYIGIIFCLNIYFLVKLIQALFPAEEYDDTNEVIREHLERSYDSDGERN